MFSQNNVTFLKLFITLIIGIWIGFGFSQLLNTTNYDLFTTTRSMRTQDETTNESGYVIYEEQTKSKFSPPPNNDTDIIIENAFGHLDELNTTTADLLFKEVKILCWVLTGPSNHEKKARHVKNTWGSRCNKLIFMSSEEDKDLGAIKLPVGEGRKNLWNKTREAFKYAYDHHLNEYDWFLKADDDTYVILENLRVFLYPMSADAPIYFGCKFKPHVRHGYMSGGAGYVLSREALKRFVELAYPKRDLCRQSMGGSEDKEMGNCLQNVGVIGGDSRDDQHRGRFFPSGPNGHIIPKKESHWYWHYIFYASKDGLNCCSDYAISFHYISPDYMYVLDYLIYKLRPFGILPKSFELPAKKNMTELLIKWRNETSDNPL